MLPRRQPETGYLKPSWFACLRAQETQVHQGGGVTVINFRFDLPLEQTMAFEAVYHEAEQLHLSEKKKICDAPGSIFAWMFADGELVGGNLWNPPCKFHRRTDRFN